MVFFHDLFSCFTYYGLNFVLVKEITIVMVLRHLMYAHLTLSLWMLHRYK